MGGKVPHVKGRLGAKHPRLEYILLCLNKVRKVRLAVGGCGGEALHLKGG